MGAAALPAAIFGGSAISGLLGKSSASSAASAQEQAAQQATQAQLQIYGQNKQMLSPYIQGGTVAQDTLMRAIPTLVKPFQPTMAQLAATPGYQFALQQGNIAAQNAQTAQGLGSSGPAAKAAIQWAEGLAGETYQQQFQNYWNQNQNIYNELAGPAGTGLQAASALAGVGTNVGNQIGSNIIGAGNAQAAGQIAGTNALTGGINSGVNNYLQASLYSNLLGGSNANGLIDPNAIGASSPFPGSPLVNP